MEERDYYVGSIDSYQVEAEFCKCFVHSHKHVTLIALGDHTMGNICPFSQLWPLYISSNGIICDDEDGLFIHMKVKYPNDANINPSSGFPIMSLLTPFQGSHNLDHTEVWLLSVKISFLQKC